MLWSFILSLDIHKAFPLIKHSLAISSNRPAFHVHFLPIDIVPDSSSGRAKQKNKKKRRWRNALLKDTRGNTYELIAPPGIEPTAERVTERDTVGTPGSNNCCGIGSHHSILIEWSAPLILTKIFAPYAARLSVAMMSNGRRIQIQISTKESRFPFSLWNRFF